MKKFFDFLFSMQFAGTLMLVFAVAIGMATFVENDLGTLAAKLIVYEAKWFEILLLIMAISMIGSIFKYNLYKRKKYTVLLFHISFVIILIGAGITRYLGYEGTMRIREGASSNEIITEHPFIQVKINDSGREYYYEHQKLFNQHKNNSFDKIIDFGSKSCQLSFVEFIPNAAETIVPDANGDAILSLVSGGMGGRETRFLKSGEMIDIQGIPFQFNMNSNAPGVVSIIENKDSLLFNAPFDVNITAMSDGTITVLEAGQFHPFDQMQLYSFDNKRIVLNSYLKHARTKLVNAGGNPKNGGNSAVILNLNYNGMTSEIQLFGGKGYIGEENSINLGDVRFNITYGSKIIEIPFELYLRDFQLERYPGSMSPSSFASEVTLIDNRHNLKEDRRIFMNNVLNYEGFRFFQSSYDKDEKGTILSVNHDSLGTIVTYIGYFIMALGMILNFFHKDSRFRHVQKKLRTSGTSLLLITLIGVGSLVSNPAQSQMRVPYQNVGPENAIDLDHAKDFGTLMVQDQKGRIEPINTLASEIIRKITKKGEFNGLHADQVFLGMISEPLIWQAVPMIKVSDAGIKRVLGINSKYAAFNDFINYQQGGSYKLSGYVDEAYKKKPAMRNSFDKDLIKVDERVNIAYMVYSGDFLKIFPKRNDHNDTWYSYKDISRFDSTDAEFIRNIMPVYYSSLKKGKESGNWSEARQNLEYIRTYQNTLGSHLFPSAFKTKLEILYNDLNVFKKLFPYFALIGFLMLIMLFIQIMNPKAKFKWPIRVGIWLITFGFMIQTLGLVSRWYISGHAPWSNGYESMIYIAWATVMAGLFFVKKSKITVATTAILASLTLMVANLSWMDPEITNLVPVLKSYWLVIHVAVITASYSFLAIGALLGFLNLILMNLKNPRNLERINATIKELTNINEMNIIIGGFLITIGTFLGAVWANESWGRYWGWDPKETWALVTVVIYAFVVHMRMTPGLRGTYAFNFAALISFSSVLMTYFGVNYYLSGLHSYAQGDPVPIPNFVYYAIVIIAVVSIMAFINNKKYLKKKEEDHL